MRTYFIFLIFLCACGQSDSIETTVSDQILGNNLRGKQLSKSDFEKLFASGVKTVIRLNGNENCLSIAAEKSLCEAAGVDFYYFNIEGKNKLNTKNLKTISALLDGGNCFLHCKHGVDRTGAAIAFWLRKRGFSPSEIQKHNRWNANYPNRGQGYYLYYTCSL